MARLLRIDQEDTFYHMLNRGNEQRAAVRMQRTAKDLLRAGTSMIHPVFTWFVIPDKIRLWIRNL